MDAFGYHEGGFIGCEEEALSNIGHDNTTHSLKFEDN